MVYFNYKNSQVIALNSECHELVQNHNNPDELSKVHPDLFNTLTAQEYIINDEVNEELTAIENITNHLSSQDCFQITINPTMDCNLRCWYCYESHIKQSKLHPNIQNGIIHFINIQLHKHNFKNVRLSFFGGEPLMRINSSVLPIASETKKICDSLGITLHLHFTTNAVLLTQDGITSLKAIDPNCTFQIPFDGDQNTHDKIKMFGDGLPTYDIILRNISRLLCAGMNVIGRFNYDEKNISGFRQTLQDLHRIEQHIQTGNLNVVFQKIWQAKETAEIRDAVESLINIAKEYNLIQSDDATVIRSSYCYADYRHQYVINYNGDVYKCTARPFTKEFKIGSLNQYGKLSLTIPESEFINIRFKGYCKECILLPICHVCWQFHRDTKDDSKCHLNLTSQDKEDEIFHKFKEIIGIRMHELEKSK